MTLNARQSCFVAEYAVDFNATRAAKTAGYSQRTARQAGSRLLTNVDVQRALTRAQTATVERTQVTTDFVVAKLVALLEASTTPPAVQVAALGLLAKHTGGFVDRRQVESGTLVKFVPAMGGVHAGDEEAASNIGVGPAEADAPGWEGRRRFGLRLVDGLVEEASDAERSDSDAPGGVAERGQPGGSR